MDNNKNYTFYTSLFFFRVVVQPWLRLTYLNISFNKLTQLDDSLQVLPVIKEVKLQPVGMFALSHSLSIPSLSLPFPLSPSLPPLSLPPFPPLPPSPPSHIS